MSSVVFEVKNVKPKTQLKERQLDLFKSKETNSDKHRKSRKKLVIPLLSKRTTLRHKLDQNSSADDSLNDVFPKRGRTDNGSSFNIQKLKDDVEIGDNVEAGDYEDMPIEDFGLAIFRGMGWEEGTEDVSAPVVVPRSKGLGLGADKMVAGNGDGDLKKGCCCEVIAGKMKGSLGVEGWDEVRVMVKMGTAIEAINPNFVVEISLEEFEGKQKKGGIMTSQPNGTKKGHSHQTPRSGSGGDDEAPWLHSDLVVRVVSKTYQGGRFYKQKVTIVDVTDTHTCMCRTDQQHLLEDVKQSMLETVVPREDDSFLLILTHPHKFNMAKLLERHKKTQMAVVKLESGGDDDGKILHVHYDDICLYKPPFH